MIETDVVTDLVRTCVAQIVWCGTSTIHGFIQNNDTVQIVVFGEVPRKTGITQKILSQLARIEVQRRLWTNREVLLHLNFVV